MKKIFLLMPFLAMFFITLADDDVFQRPSTKHLVVDKANVFSDWQVDSLTAKLNSFDRATSTQIQIYTTTDLQGYSIADFGQRLGEGWGVGQAGFNNGIVIVYKPKTETEKGEVTIQTGYGIEPLIPDAICKRIIENEMIPCFREENVYQGIDKAVDICISLTKGEFTVDDYNKKTSGDYSGGSSSSDVTLKDILILILIFAPFFGIQYLYVKKHPNSVSLSSGSYSSRSDSSDYYSSDYDSDDYDSDDYGGGSFGGGGASGSW